MHALGRQALGQLLLQRRPMEMLSGLPLTSLALSPHMAEEEKTLTTTTWPHVCWQRDPIALQHAGVVRARFLNSRHACPHSCCQLTV